MGSRSITKLVMSDGAAAFYLHWGSPEYQIPRLGQWVHEVALRDQPLTVAGWEQWAAEVNGDTGSVVAAERLDGPEPGDLEHVYVIGEDESGFGFHYFHRPDADAGWRVVVDCDSVAELLAAGVDQVTRHRAETAALRAEKGWGPNDPIPGLHTVAELDEWVSECQERAATHAALFGEELTARRPDPDALPERVAGQDEAEYLLARAECCIEAAANVIEFASARSAEGDPEAAEALQADARGLMYESGRAMALHRAILAR